MTRLLVVVLCLFTSAPLWGHDDHHAHRGLLAGAIFPRLSPSGETIAFSYQGALWRVPRAGGEMMQLTADVGFDVQPAWSPDGKRIAFINGRRSFQGPLLLISADNGRPLKLPAQVLAKDRLFFHPNGTQILGSFRQGGGGFSLCWFDLDTGKLGKSLRPDVWGQRFALSPDGKSIALATSQDIRGEQGGNNGPQCDLWIMPSQGGDRKSIVRFPGRVYEVEWSANGESLYVVSNVGGVHNDIWRVPLENPLRGARKLTFGQADEDSPAESKDGNWLLYTDNRHGPTALVLRDLRAGKNTLVTATTRRFQKPTGTLSLRVTDAHSRNPVTARVSVRELDGKFHAPPGALYRMLGGDVHFYCRGSCRMEVPVGRYLVKVNRGPEYSVQRMQVEVKADRSTEQSIVVRRWIHQQQRSWHSGESHIHANYGYGQWYNSPRTMLAQCAGEDLVVSNFMVANSEADGVFDREYFRGAPDPLSTEATILYWNQEFRSTIWGHMTLLNLKQLVEPIFTGFAQTTHPHDHPTNADVADLTHDQDAHVNYTHPAHNVQDPYLSAYSAKALPLDVALGKVDSIDVMGLNHVATMPLWYRLLNCGFRVPASAGTDCFLNRVRSRLPGQDRVYVRVEGGFSYERWIENLKAGRTFVTNGPMLDFTVNGKLAGDVVAPDNKGNVRVRGRAVSQYPLNRVEIIYNGEVIANAELDDPSLEVEIDRSLPIPRSGWIALRAGGPNHADQPAGTVFSHTSAVYVEVPGKPINAREHAEYFINWIERLRTDVRRRNRIPSRHQVHVESQIAAAREVFNKLLKD